MLLGKFGSFACKRFKSLLAIGSDGSRMILSLREGFGPISSVQCIGNIALIVGWRHQGKKHAGFSFRGNVLHEHEIIESKTAVNECKNVFRI